MSKQELEHLKIEHTTRRLFFVVGIVVAFILALANSDYTSAAFAFVGGLLSGSVLEKKI